MLIIPVNQESSLFSIRVVLDRTPFRLTFKFNSRQSSWYFDLFDDGGAILRAGIRIVADSILLSRMRTSIRPRGDFAVIDTNNTQQDPGRNTFGDEMPMYYFEEQTIIDAIG